MDFAVNGTGNDRSASGPDASGPFASITPSADNDGKRGHPHGHRRAIVRMLQLGKMRPYPLRLLPMLNCFAVLMFASVLAAQQPFRVCSDPRTARLLWSDAAACNEVPLSSYPCDLIANLPHCDPPAVARFRFPVPWDGTVRFAGITTDLGRTYWTWTKAGEPSRPCSPTEASEQAHYGKGCAARIGDVLFRTPPVYVP
jgi:hypothetical protein